MAGVELAALTAPVTEADPCGPDLDLEGDLDYLNFTARVEGVLPASFFSVRDGKPFDRASINFPAEFEAAKPLLERTRDLRLMATIAKLHILDRDLAGFETVIEAVAALLDGQWDQVHPRGENGDYGLRVAAIETLDDLPTVVHPLQFVPLVNHRRIGIVTYRHQMTASGEVQPREDEEQPLDAATVEKALMEAELPPLIELMKRFETLQAALGRIRTIWIDRAGFDQAVTLERLPLTVGKILAFVSGIVARREPAAAGVAEGGAAASAADTSAAAVPTGPIASAADAAEALAAAARYFSRMEPSNPALLLVRQAEQLIGRSFAEIMRILVPGHADQANIAIGGQQVFDLPIERLSTLDPGAGAYADATEARQDDALQTTSNDHSAAPVASDADNVIAEQSTSETTEQAPEAGDQQQDTTPEASPEPTEPDPPAASPPPRSRPQAATRQQALVLLDQVAAFYRAAEPTSPVAVLIDRARSLAGRDFMSLLKDFLPEAALRSIVPEDRG